MSVPFFDLSRQTLALRDDLQRAMMEVIDSTRFIQGPAVRKFESEVSDALSVEHAVGVASGSDAVLLALMAAGIAPGDEVIVPAFSFFSTASAVSRLGATIRFADIDPVTFQIDPNDIERRISPRTRAVIATHLYGDCADLEPIQALAGAAGFPMIEDAAQAFAARYKGRSAGTFGLCGCFSFYPTKNLAALGDGGMIVTNDDATAEQVRLLSQHGARNRYEHETLGINSRLDALQAAALSVKLRYLPAWNARRVAIAQRYSDALQDVVQVPRPPEANMPVFHQYVIRTPQRDQLRDHLSGKGIGTEIYYPIPLHLQQGLAPDCGKPGDYPNAEEVSSTCLALPIFPELEDGEVDSVIEAVLQFSPPGPDSGITG
jgi:dTDP-4-amino-4,6-dideoxygalactose transaminase